MRGGGFGAEGLTVGQTTAGGSGAGGGGRTASFGASVSAGGSGRVGLALGLALTACTFPINHRPADISNQQLLQAARFGRAAAKLSQAARFGRAAAKLFPAAQYDRAASWSNLSAAGLDSTNSAGRQKPRIGKLG